MDGTGWIYININREIYGLKNSDIIVHRRFKIHLGPHGYRLVLFTPSLWKSNTKQTMFILVVEYFATKYIEPESSEHLFSGLLKKYGITTNLSYKYTLVFNFPGIMSTRKSPCLWRIISKLIYTSSNKSSPKNRIISPRPCPIHVWGQGEIFWFPI